MSNKEHIKQLAEVMLAYVNGEDVQYYDETTETWYDSRFVLGATKVWRVKPKTVVTYAPVYCSTLGHRSLESLKASLTNFTGAGAGVSGAVRLEFDSKTNKLLNVTQVEL